MSKQLKLMERTLVWYIYIYIYIVLFIYFLFCLKRMDIILDEELGLPNYESNYLFLKKILINFDN